MTISKAVREVAAGYQVMVDGREREIIDLTHDEAVMALMGMLDHFEEVDEGIQREAKRMDDFRFGRKSRSA